MKECPRCGAAYISAPDSPTPGSCPICGHLEVGKTTTPAALCICGDPLPEAPLTWGAKRFCTLACFASWYMVSGSDGSEGAPLAYRDYADHVKACPTCSVADREEQLCAEGGTMFDALDDDPTDPGVKHETERQ